MTLILSSTCSSRNGQSKIYTYLFGTINDDDITDILEAANVPQLESVDVGPQILNCDRDA